MTLRAVKVNRFSFVNFFQSKLKSIFIFKYSSFGGRIHNGTIINDYFKFSMSILDTK